MGSNLLKAILNISKFGNTDLKNYSSTYLNRINAAGEQLEFYIKDSFANSFKKLQAEKEGEYGKTFSYLGNQNNPPDIVVKNGDAFEIKKIENPKSALALNSSPPKDKLLSSDIRITNACRNCEANKWVEKDLFYVIGHAIGGKIKYLFFIHGTCYAADHKVYDKVRRKMKSINNKRSFNYNPRYGKLKNPLIYFKEYLQYAPDKFNIYAIIESQKYMSFPQKDRIKLERWNNIQINEINIPSQENQNKMITVKMISCAL